MRRHGPQTLIGSLIVTVVGAVVSVVLTSMVSDGGDDHGIKGGLSVSASAGRAGSGSATPSCSGQGCDGLDPKSTRCADDAQTIAKDWAGTMYLEIRFSPRCRTVWAKLTGAEVDDTVEIRTSPNRRQAAKVHTGHTNYTPMLAAGGAGAEDAQDFTAQASAVAVNPMKRAVEHGYVMTIGAGATDLPSATPTP
ncbi:DUF2690 domain-containing protein [Streptomyces sp. V3I7]|uniref:DUF2690 domain-containing protein n=1 Tax=Streptomyces sp. V3I7 TaxID=3042278 RepID=UPI0027D7ED81|nr:DUF2690 domain-containing protein [Streptomyces sp. V3I7]